MKKDDIFKPFLKTIQNKSINDDKKNDNNSKNDKKDESFNVDVKWQVNTGQIKKNQEIKNESKETTEKDKPQDFFWLEPPVKVKMLNETTILFQGYVGEDSVNLALSLLKRAYINANLIGLNYPEFRDKLTIKFIVDSGGGSIISGFRLCDGIKWYNNNTNVKVVGYANGMCASMAVPILLSCHEKYMTPNSTLMIHSLSSFSGGNYHQLQDMMKFYTDLQEKLTTYIANNSKIKEEKVRELMKRESYLTTEEALDYGLIDGIKETMI